MSSNRNSNNHDDHTMQMSLNEQSYMNSNQGMSDHKRSKQGMGQGPPSNECSSSQPNMDSTVNATKGRWTAEEH